MFLNIKNMNRGKTPAFFELKQNIQLNESMDKLEIEPKPKPTKFKPVEKLVASVVPKGLGVCLETPILIKKKKKKKYINF